MLPRIFRVLHMNEARFSFCTTQQILLLTHCAHNPDQLWCAASPRRAPVPKPKHLWQSASPHHRHLVTRSVSHPYEGKRTPNTAVRRAEGKSESKRVGQKVRAVAQPYRVKIATWDQPEPALAALARELLGLPGQAALRHWPRLRRGPCRCCRLARARRHQALEARASFYEEGAGR